MNADLLALDAKQLKAAIQQLPLSYSDRETVLSDAQNPGMRSLWFAMFVAAVGIVSTTTYWGGWSPQFPAPDAPPVHPSAAFSAAATIKGFYLGIIQILIAVHMFAMRRAARRQYRLLQALVRSMDSPQSA